MMIAVAMLCSTCQRTHTDAPAGTAAPAAKPGAKAANPALRSFPAEWFYYGSRRADALRQLEGQAAPEIKVKNWVGQPQSVSGLKGQILVIDFWASWCGPCMRALPHTNELAETYRNRGVTFIGIHSADDSASKVPMIARNSNITYPLAVDDGGVSAKAYHVYFWPTYVVIDRNGIIRGAGLMPEFVEKALLQVLAEQPS